MNTKIYNGFKLNNINSMDQLYDYIGTFAEKLLNAANDIWTTVVVNDAVLLYDYNSFINVDHSDSYMADSNESVEKDLLIACQRRIISQLDLEVRLCFRLIEGKKENYVVGLHFIPNMELKNIFLMNENVEDYSFDDSIDKPETVTKKDWNRRKLDWNHVFKNSNNPDSAMFTINVIKTGPRPIAINEISKFIPNKKTRSENLANKLIIDSLVSKNNTETTFTTHEEVLEHLNSQEHKDKVIKESKKMVSGLGDITSEELI